MFAIISAMLAALASLLGSGQVTPAPQPAPHYAPPKVVVDQAVHGVSEPAVQQVVTEVVNDPRSWQVGFADVTFRIVPVKVVRSQCAGDADACAGGWMGRQVIMSDRAWRKLAPGAAHGVTLADQRAWYINHELGHLTVGLGHAENCHGSGQAAPLMRPYAYLLDGCKFNAWPANGVS